MGKRSRRERRMARLARAAESGDVATLVEMAERQPASAVAPIARAFAMRANDHEFIEALIPGVERAAATLRQAGQTDRALELLRAAGRRTSRLRMEEALAAFAAGDDMRARELALLDPQVERHVGPLLAALDGHAVPRPRGLGAEAAALAAAAQVVAACVRGDGAEARKACAKLGRWRQDVARAFSACAAIATRAHARVPVRELRGAPSNGALRQALAAEWIDACADRPLSELGQVLGVTADEERSLGRRFVARALERAPGTHPGAWANLIATIGGDAFDAPERGAAFLYQAFGTMAADPAAARRAVDRAIDQGCDMLEAFRARLLIARRFESDPRAVGTAADRFAHALVRSTVAGPLVAAAALEGARAWCAAHELERARASIALGRPFATGSIGDDFDLLAAEVAGSGPEAARQALDLLRAVTRRRPANAEAWLAQVELLRSTARSNDEIAATLREAVAACSDRRLAHELRRLRIEEDELAPLGELEPGRVGAGQLAAELAEHLSLVQQGTPASELPETARACRAALAEDARLAFDAARVAILEARDPTQLGALLTELGRGRSANETTAIASIALLLFRGDALAGFASDLATESPHAALGVIRAALAAGDVELARHVLRRVAPRLSRRELSFIRARIELADREIEPDAGIPDPLAQGRQLDRLLAPDFSILALAARLHAARREKDTAPPDADRAVPGSPPCSVVASLLEHLGVSPQVFARLAPEAREELDALAHDLVIEGPDERKMIRIAELLGPFLPYERYAQTRGRRRSRHRELSR